MSQERTEKATPKKLRDMRKKGQVIKSQDLGAALSLLGMLFTLGLAGNHIINGLIQMIQRTYAQLGTANWTEAIENAGWDFLRIAGPLLGAAVLLALVSNLFQIGFVFSTESLKPKLSNLNPLSGLKKMFSAQALVNTAKSLLKFTIMGVGAWLVLADELENIILASFNEGWGIYQTMAGVAGALALRLGLLFAFVGILDYFWQRYDHSRRARMTKQEVKDEFKHTEGDPFIKSKLRERRSQISRNRMISDVANATMVVRNPTHYAVALYYKNGETFAPRVVAKGANNIALRIVEIAKQNDVPSFTRPELARALFRTCEVGDEIPEAMFKLVAELIATVYQRGGRI